MQAEWRWLPLTKNVRISACLEVISRCVREELKKRGLARPEPKKHEQRAFHGLINFSIALNWEKLIFFKSSKGGFMIDSSIIPTLEV